LPFYTLNLGFDLGSTDSVKWGAFEQRQSALPALQQSETWLESVGYPAPDSVFTVLDDAKITVLAADRILIRLFSASTIEQDSLTAGSVLVIGRRNHRQAFRTPFTCGDGNARAILNSGNPVAPNFGGVSWLFDLGTIVNAPPPLTQPYEFRFIAGATVMRNETLYTFGHDPEMDVGPGVGPGH
jgi:hypothetical protein